MYGLPTGAGCPLLAGLFSVRGKPDFTSTLGQPAQHEGLHHRHEKSSKIHPESNPRLTLGIYQSFQFLSVQEQSRLGIFNHPGQALFEILPRHGTAPQNMPLVRPNAVQLQPGCHLLSGHASLDVCFVGKHQ